mmetsp:Transcript_46839/g.80592  ORF Transcript_46839/g.80592 Transcript_46839/m.80592 type:complete len:231 (-) Transcript_46839:333-1025(-)
MILLLLIISRKPSSIVVTGVWNINFFCAHFITFLVFFFHFRQHLITGARSNFWRRHTRSARAPNWFLIFGKIIIHSPTGFSIFRLLLLGSLAGNLMLLPVPLLVLPAAVVHQAAPCAAVEARPCPTHGTALSCLLERLVDAQLFPRDGSVHGPLPQRGRRDEVVPAVVARHTGPQRRCQPRPVELQVEVARVKCARGAHVVASVQEIPVPDPPLIGRKRFLLRVQRGIGK